MELIRRSLILLSLLSPMLTKPARAAGLCVPDLDALVFENAESPFFEHFHQMIVPVSALIRPPAAGIVVHTTAIDLGSYDIAGFEKFVAQSGLKRADLLSHSHAVAISQAHLERIASGEKDVEVRVISKAGNYVHNFLITAPPSALVKVRKGAHS